MISERIMTLHPEGKPGVSIDKVRYDLVTEAIVASITATGALPFKALTTHAAQRLPTDFDGSVGWYTTTVKLDLEARGVIERVLAHGAASDCQVVNAAYKQRFFHRSRLTLCFFCLMKCLPSRTASHSNRRR